ncbi:hypothetical protein CHLNCDRAFT_136968 [Chlorella variabilis]|uniref:Uncharacterized protein n=1 Tax=Chlorella variabilis TaxID=554065 RepID=E1ZLP5_CHLVA|nr:hypothetical protein CHLNCDRAFT_136968 [Chlorella variabilis]EFN53169.1 hypothetical protein CHLNCDRAFT_136968 [Chlorella variabilis]|eukprot:XP_005845271.1 hypothetical protein CHLNCDRAFT_136968 [Chlorella variabilis]
MAQQSATLQSHVTQLASCLEELQQQRASLVATAREEEAERARLAQDAAVLQRRLCQLEASLEKRQAAKEAFDRVILQTQGALSKLVESSHMLLTVTKRNAAEVASLTPPRGAVAAAPAGTAAVAAALG